MSAIAPSRGICRYAVPILALLALGSCQKLFDKPDDTALLGFTKPVSLIVNLAFTEHSTGAVYTEDIDDPCLTGALVATGIANPTPTPDTAPYWNFSTPLPVSDSKILVNIGMRKITSRTNIRTWKQDSSDFFGETIEYIIPGAAPIRPPNSEGFGPFSERVVFVNNPAVGEWKLLTVAPNSPDSDPPPSEGAVIHRAMFPGGQCSKEMIGLNTAIGNARLASMNALEKRLSDSGLMQRTAIPNVVLSRQYGKLYYVSPEPLAPATVFGASETCANLTVANLSWRIPNSAEINQIFLPNSQILIDTPDHRIWPRLYGSNTSTDVHFVTFAINPFSGQTLEQGLRTLLSNTGVYFGLGFEQVSANGFVQLSSKIFVDGNKNDPLMFDLGQFSRAVCTTDVSPQVATHLQNATTASVEKKSLPVDASAPQGLAVDEARRWVADHPTMFSDRKIYSVDSITIARPTDRDVIDGMGPLKTMESVEAYLAARHIHSVRSLGKLDTLELTPKLAENIAKLPPGEVFMFPIRNNMMVIDQIRQTKSAPLVGEQGVKYALDLLKNLRLAAARAKTSHN